jgi:hypothetical protein
MCTRMLSYRLTEVKQLLNGNFVCAKAVPAVRRSHCVLTYLTISCHVNSIMVPGGCKQ